MRYMKGTMGLLITISIMGASMDAFGFLGFGGTRWKEEVLLHDGGKIIVERSQSYGGRHEIGQSPPVKKHTIAFTLPDSGKAMSWTSEYGDELGRTNFNMLALHILNGTPYLVAEPNLCLSYNKWGRPNPPYVFFKYEGTVWQRIPLSALPSQFKTINMIVNNGREEDIEKAASNLGYVPAEGVQRINSSLPQPEYKTILREPVPQGSYGSSVNCEELIPFGKAGWFGLDWFKEQPSYESCVKFCEKKGVNPEHCPCERIFGRK
ncbi:MAG: hypothetical protein WC001_09450 [Desulfurivibrionaceae bacterium]